MKIKYVITTMDTTIIDQINKFLKNIFDFVFVAKKPGSTRIKTVIKKIIGII